MNIAGSYDCNCTSTGYENQYCDDDINECNQNDTCLNGGRCQNNNGSFMCHCQNTGYKGTRCDIDVNECKETIYPCEMYHNVRCVNSIGSFECICYGNDNTLYICGTGKLSN